MSSWGGLHLPVRLNSSSQQCLLPALRRGAGGALVKHFRMEITIYNYNTSASLNTENKKKKIEERNLLLPPGRSSYLIPEDRFSVCAIFVAGSAVCKRASSAENLRETHYESGGQKLSRDVESKQPHTLLPLNLSSLSEVPPAVWLLSSETAGLEQAALTQRAARQDKVTRASSPHRCLMSRM